MRVGQQNTNPAKLGLQFLKSIEVGHIMFKLRGSVPACCLKTRAWTGRQGLPRARMLEIDGRMK